MLQMNPMASNASQVLTSLAHSLPPHPDFTIAGFPEYATELGGDQRQILLRAATAALLNEAYFKDGYPPYGSVTELANAVNATLATQDEAKYVAMAAELDWWNNGVH